VFKCTFKSAQEIHILVQVHFCLDAHHFIHFLSKIKHLKNNFPLGKDYILPDIVSPETIFSFLLVLAP